MAKLNQRNQRVSTDHFSMVQRADIPRSTFRTEHTHKTTFDGGILVPIYLDECLPGDSTHGDMTLFARLSTLLFPLMDHIVAETFFFFVPCRLLWTNWVKFMGEQVNPGDSISYTIPQTTIAVGGSVVCSIADYFGIPNGAQVTGTKLVNALPFRAYNLIYSTWFRDENLSTTAALNTGDGPDALSDYNLLRRAKKHDYFTSCLPFAQKGADVTIPLAGSAPVTGIGYGGGAPTSIPGSYYATEGIESYTNWYNATLPIVVKAQTAAANSLLDIRADLSVATSATINALRLAFQTQRFLEKDARGGTRYVESLRMHWGVTPQDYRLQRPEYIGGGRSEVQTQAIPQTSATGLTGGTTPIAGLAGSSTLTGSHRFSYQAQEHGYIIGLIHVDAELTYQQGLHKLWTRSTRYDLAWPVFAHLGEQQVLEQEIYLIGGLADVGVFGYQERYAEYRHKPSRISGKFRSTATGTLDAWHAAQNFTSAPVLNTTFINSTPPFNRNFAAGNNATNQQLLADMLFRISTTRALPMYGTPGGIDRF